MVPSGTPSATLAPLDSGNELDWDVLSRPTSKPRGVGPEVQISGFDLGSRPQTVDLGANWSWVLNSTAASTKDRLDLLAHVSSDGGGVRHFASDISQFSPLEVPE